MSNDRGEESANVVLMREFLGILDGIHTTLKEHREVAIENKALVERTWEFLARIETRFLETRRELEGELEANKKKPMLLGWNLSG